jgi:amino acid transporter
MIGMAFIVALYLAVQTVAIGTLPGLAESTRPLADAAAAFLGPFGGGLIALGAVVSVLGNLTVVTLVASRLLFAMGERRELPAWMGAVHPSFRTPHFAIYATMAVMLTLALSGTFAYAATISVVTRLFVYAVTCAAVPVFRRSPQKAAPAGFLIPGGRIIAVLALLLIVWLLLQTTLGEARDTGIAILIGFALYFLNRRR